MGQKAHPIGLRLVKFLNWGTEWYTKKKEINSKLLYQSYQLKYFLISYLFNKELLVHSFSSKYKNNTLYLKVNIVPTYNYYKYLILKFYKKYLFKVFYKRLYFLKIYCLYLILKKKKINTYNYSLQNKIFNYKKKKLLKLKGLYFNFFLQKIKMKSIKNIFILRKKLKEKNIIKNCNKKINKITNNLIKRTFYKFSNSKSITNNFNKNSINQQFNKKNKLNLKNNFKYLKKKFNQIKIFLKLYFYYIYILKYSYKYSKIPIYNIANHYKEFRKYQLFFIQPISLPRNFYSIFPKSISNSNQLFNVSIIIKNLNKSCLLTEEMFKKFLIFSTDNIWYYYFYIMYKTYPSSLLIGNFIKKFLGKRSLRKKQRFFLNNLRRFITSFFKRELFEKLKGLKIQIKGKLNGKDRAFNYRIRIGSVPLSTISQKINYNFFPVNTLFGSFGVKIWIVVNNVST